jgi:flagellar protein FliL
MKNNKLLLVTLIILVTITLFCGILYVLFTQLNKDTEKNQDAPTIDEILVASIDIPEITTNLADKRYVKLQLKIQTSGEDAAAELAKRDFQVKNLIIQELSEMSQEDLGGKDGKQALQRTLKSQINELMDEGEVQQVYITSYIIQ